MRSGRDPGARRALIARNKAREIAYNSISKIGKLSEILKKHNESKIFIFTEHNKLVHIISTEFLIPSITYRTTSKERSETLDRFRSGIYRAVVTSRVLDEGIDVSDADVVLFLAEREAKGRLSKGWDGFLKERRKGGSPVEIVSAETSETNTARRRKRSLKQ